MPSNNPILCRPLLLPPSIFPSIRVFSKESVLCIRWPKYWSFVFSISPSSECSGLISFRMDWLDLLAVWVTLKSLLQHHSSKASILRRSAFFIVQLSYPHLLDFSQSLAIQSVSYFSVHTHRDTTHTYRCDSFLHRWCSRFTLIITKKISDAGPHWECAGHQEATSFIFANVSITASSVSFLVIQTGKTSFHKANGNLLSTAFLFQDHSWIESLACWRWI